MLKPMIFVLILLLTGAGATAQPILLGIAGAVDQDSLLYASGFRLTGTTVGSLLAPSVSDSAFIARLEGVRKMKCKLFMCNVLFPGTLKIAGPDVDERAVLTYLEAVLRRARAAGIENLILGSGGARRLPDGYDKKKAATQFSLLARKMAELAERYGVTIILENLNSSETNFLNTLSEAAHLVRGVDHPYFRLNADIYHMMKEDEPPQSIVNAGGLITYVELAEEKDRSLPGVSGEDFRPYLKALKEIRFKGPMMIEGRTTNPSKDIPFAYAFLMKQIKEVYDEERKSKVDK